MKDEKIILRTSGLPFKTERAANLRIGVLAKEGKMYTAIPWTVDAPEDGGDPLEGWALERLDSLKRPERIPVGQRNRLTAPQRPGYVRRWVNNEPGRLQMFEQAGYKMVTDQNYDPANPGVVRVGDPSVGKPTPMGSTVVEEVGGGKRAVLMEQRQDWYLEDQKLKQNKINEMEAQIKRRPNKDGFYGDIKADFDARDPSGKKAKSAIDMDQGQFE